MPNFSTIFLHVKYLSKQPYHHFHRFPPTDLVQLPGQIRLSMLFPMVFQTAGGLERLLTRKSPYRRPINFKFSLLTLKRDNKFEFLDKKFQEIGV